jgi:hypothetical protein
MNEVHISLFHFNPLTVVSSESRPLLTLEAELAAQTPDIFFLIFLVKNAFGEKNLRGKSFSHFLYRICIKRP